VSSRLRASRKRPHPTEATINRTRIVSEYVANAVSTPLPADVDELARCHVLDTLAAIVACRDLDAAVVARRYVSRWGGTVANREGAATILGTHLRAPLVDAAFAGAMTGHAAEINDFIPSVFVQPGPRMVATALAVGETTDASGVAVLRAIVAGYEIATRVIRAVGVGNLRRAGIANHGVGPCFGSAVAASVLLGMPVDDVAHVLSLTAQQAAGSWQWLLDVEHIEKAFVFAGLGARNGTHAALLVDAGFRGVPDVVDRAGTWFTSALFSDGDGDLDALTRDLGSRSVLADVAYKRYPVGGPTQPAVEALLALQPSVDVTDIARVHIEMPGRYQAFRDAAMPALNLRYLAAIILIDGQLDFTDAQSLQRMHADPAVRELMDRVELSHDPAQEAAPGEPRTESAKVTIHRTVGEPISAFVPHVLGFPSHPMTSDDVEQKARGLMTPHLGPERAELVVESTRDLAALRAGELSALVARDDA
jgi:2-methylcitrate dehydratase PrpD